MNDAKRRVVIGMDPHKRSVTIEVMTADETIVGAGRFGTDVAGFARDEALCQPVPRPHLGDRGLQRDRPPRGDEAPCRG